MTNKTSIEKLDKPTYEVKSDKSALLCDLF